jgi:hypothetical protein
MSLRWVEEEHFVVGENYEKKSKGMRWNGYSGEALVGTVHFRPDRGGEWGASFKLEVPKSWPFYDSQEAAQTHVEELWLSWLKKAGLRTRSGRE